MSDINRVTIIGGLTRDPELKYTKSGKEVVSFSIGTTSGFGEKKKSNYFNVVAWGKLAEVVCQYTKRGSKVGIEGRLDYRSWEDQNGNKRSTVEIIADNVQFLTPKSDNTAHIQNNPFDDTGLEF